MKILVRGGAGFIGLAVIRHLILNTNHTVIKVELLGSGFSWLDTGTHESLIEASNFVHTVEKRQGFKIACLEEISFRNGWIDAEQVASIGHSLSKTGYGQYPINIAKGFI